jgi:hypothetical protein
VADAWVDGGIDGFSGLLCRRYVGTHVVGTDDRATHTEAEDAHVASLAAQSVDDGANIFQGDREAVLTGTRKVVNEVKSEQVLGPRVSSLGEC